MTAVGSVRTMLAAADDVEVHLMRLIKLASKSAAKSILVVEGNDDVTFFQTTLSRLRPGLTCDFLNCKGKDAVLSLFDVVFESEELEHDRIRFAVDRDFDDLKGRDMHPQLYMTPTYSIENLLATREVLKSLLVGEFRCTGPDGYEDVDSALKVYDSIIEQYRSALLPVNLVLFFCRVNSLSTNGIDDVVTKGIKLGSGGIKVPISDQEALRRIPRDAPLTEEDLEKVRSDFNKLVPETRWRGKFLFKIFVEFLTQLSEDRSSRAPKYFKSKQKVTFHAKSDSIRALGAVFSCPNCLRDFVLAFPDAA